MELVFVATAKLFGELGEESGGNGNADEVDWHLVKRGGLLEAAEDAGAHAGGEVGADDGVDVVDALVERASGEEAKDATEALVFPFDFEVVVEAEAKEAEKTSDELEHGTKSDADGDAHDATIENLPAEEVDAAGEDGDAEQDADVIHGGGEGVEDEATDGLLHGGEDGGDAEEEGVDGDDAHHVDGKNGAGFVQTGADDVADERVGKNHDENAGDESDEGEEIEK